MYLFSTNKSSKEEWISLFNGKDLEGWDIKIKGFELNNNYKNTFRVENGNLVVSYDEWDKWNGEFGHIFYKTPYSHYRLRVEYRFVGEQVPEVRAGHSGTTVLCFIHNQRLQWV